MLSLTLLALLHAAPDAGVAPFNPATQAAMRGLYGALLGLEPYLARPQGLKSKKEEQTFLAHLDALAQLKHAFPADPKAQEPATAALSSLFSRYALDTRRAFERGEKSTVHLRVRTLVSLCFTCHSRERAIEDFADAAKAVDALELDPLDRAQYLAATRQFDRALEAYRAVVDVPLADERALMNHTRALRDAMAILVRVKDDAAGVAALLDAEAKRPDLPSFLRGSVKAWRADVTVWQKERFDALKASPAALFKKAQGLVKKADSATSYFPDERADVKLLRASASLNLALGKEPAFAQRGEALYLLGVCAAGLKSPLLWDVDQLFFEACVRENAHRPVASRCFKQLSDRVYFGFTGSGGTHVPDDEMERLTELRALAEPSAPR